MALETKNILGTFQLILKKKKQGKTVPSAALQQMLVWATMNDPSIMNQTVYDPETWDQIGVKLWDSIKNKVAAGLLSRWPAPG